MKALCVVLHDVAAPTWDACTCVLQAIAEVATPRLSLLAVPHWHGAERSPDFERWLSARGAAGDEIALHGCTHVDDGAPRGLVDRAHRRLYTAGEGEFCALNEHEAARRLDAGLRWLRELGVQPQGFVAPAWMLGEGAWDALRRSGLRYTCTLSRLVLLPDGPSLRSQARVYSTRNAWRRTTSIAWNRLLGAARASDPLWRLELHPHDADFAPVRRSWQGLLARSLREREAITLAQAAQRLSDETQRALGGEQADGRADRHVARVVQTEHDPR